MSTTQGMSKPALLEALISTYIDAHSGGPDAKAAEKRHNAIREELLKESGGGEPQRPPDANPHEWRHSIVEARACLRTHNTSIPSHWIDAMLPAPTP